MTIVIPGVQNGPQGMAVEINGVVKKHLGRSRPFMFLVVNEAGDAMLLSNMDIHEERCRLLAQTLTRLRSSS